MTALQGIALVIFTVSLMGLMFWLLTRSYDKEEARWENLGGGTVANAFLSDLPYVHIYGESMLALRDQSFTAIVFDDGRSVTILGDHVDQCIIGTRVTIMVNGLGKFRVDPAATS
jgi:hypothetical protein